MTLTIGNDLESVKLNQNTKYLGQMSFCSKVIVQGPDLQNILGQTYENLKKN